MLRLSSLSVSNFRSLQSQPFTFPELAVLVGKNDVGKSNVLAAIQLLLEGGSLSPVDFYDLAKPITIEAVFERAASYLPLCDTKNRSKIEDRINEQGQIRVRKITDETQKLGKIEIHNPVDNSFGTPTGIDAALKPLLPEVIFIGALDDVSEEAESSKKGAVGKLMGQILARVREKVQSQLDKAYADSSKLLNPQTSVKDGKTEILDNRLSELKDVEGRITHHLNEMFPAAAATLRVNLPIAEDLFKNVEILIREGGNQPEPYYRRGHGLQRALHLSLLRSLAFYIRQETGKEVTRPFILLFEEPEACLHPDGQVKMRKALVEIAKQEQVIIATHSPILIAPEMIDRTLRLEKIASAHGPRPVTIAHGPLKTSELPASEREMQRLFEIQRSAKFLFARGVLLVEGIGDEHLIAAAAKVRREFDFDFHEIAIVESGGKDRVLPFMGVLRKLGLKTWGLLDLDFLWNGAGEVFQTDKEYSTFLAALDKLVPTKAGSLTEADRKEEKRKKVKVCNGELSSGVQNLAKRLLAEGLYVLRKGEIERYFGMGENSKGQYLKVASAVLAGERKIEHTEDLDQLLADLQTWALSI
jgi:predicted ATP-dependent endonuclease of OLD family